MIGRNDVLNEYFFKEDAKALLRFCNTNGVKITSEWSLNRDRAIDANNNESETTQLYKSTKLSLEEYGTGKLEFTKILMDRNP